VVVGCGLYGFTYFLNFYFVYIICKDPDAFRCWVSHFGLAYSSHIYVYLYSPYPEDLPYLSKIYFQRLAPRHFPFKPRAQRRLLVEYFLCMWYRAVATARLPLSTFYGASNL
jgi:hypothetical protein